LNYYCTHFAACTTSWGVVARPALPRTLPALESPTLTRRRWARHVYYGNVCTQSYSQPWWTFREWEKELDHLALRGVTLPLIITGREVVMRQLLLEQGLSERDILAFFTGPAFLAWHRMGNLKAFGGPLPASYLHHAEALTLAILKRARALGMTPVLPGFSGHVPDELATLFARLGRANVSEFSRLPQWSGFPQEFSALTFVEPTSEVYVQLGARFVEIQRALFGADAGHFYSVDQFNEVDPRSADPAYLERAAAASHAALRQGDPDAVWVLQGWLFVFHAAFWTQPRIAAYLAGVPKNALLVLDLVSEATPGYVATKSYGGHPYLWNALLNFGGTVGMRGNAQTVMDRPYAAKRLPESSADGVGITMEAINQNPLVYELVLDHAWNPLPRDLNQWVRTWARARYGYVADAGGSLIEVATEPMHAAWALLARSAYSVFDRTQGNGFWGTTKSVVEKRPSLNAAAVLTGGFQASRLKYAACDVADAWRLLVDSAPAEEGGLVRGGALELDLVDVTRQALSDYAQPLYARWIQAVEHRDVAAAEHAQRTFLALIGDIDDVLGTHPHFSFAPWLQGAAALAANGSGGGDVGAAEEEAALYAYNARNLLTLWGPTGQIRDYASRMWSGMIRSFYFPRWELAMSATAQAMRRKSSAAPSDRVFARALDSFEDQWQRRGFDIDEQGSAAETAAKAAAAMPPIRAVRAALRKHYAGAKELCGEAV
jgi:alpha-N-acetylglucosaminidase